MTAIMKSTAAILMLATLGTAAQADRAPTADEAARIGEAMQAQGFSKWGSIEFDDGKWEIDNASHSDVKLYDVDLKPDDLSVVKKEIED